MRWTLLFILIAGTAAQQWAFQNNQQTQTQLEDEYEFDRSASYDATRFSVFDINLLERIANSNRNKNIIISPASIKTVLGLLLHGAHGSTATELQATLNLSDNQTEAQQQLLKIQQEITMMTTKFSVKTANAMFLGNQLQPKTEFKNFAEQYYFTFITNINVNDPTSAIRKINDWINKKTDGLIPNAVGQGLINRNTKLVLVNAMHFKGKWLNKFPNVTRPQYFYSSTSEKTCVNMMGIKAKLRYNYEKKINADVLQIPFQNPTYTLALVVPREKYGIAQLQSDLKSNSIVQLLSDQDKIEVTLSLPRFTAEFETELTSILKELRTTEIFSDSAKLQNIIEGSKKIKVDAVVHKAFIEVNEQGATAGATTAAAVIPLTSYGNKDLVVDRPFLFFIYHSDSKTVLFEGRVVQPQQINSYQCEAAKNLKPMKTVLNEFYNIDIRNQRPQTIATNPQDVRNNWQGKPVTIADRFGSPGNQQDTNPYTNNQQPATIYSHSPYNNQQQPNTPQQFNTNYQPPRGSSPQYQNIYNQQFVNPPQQNQNANNQPPIISPSVPQYAPDGSQFQSVNNQNSNPSQQQIWPSNVNYPQGQQQAQINRRAPHYISTPNGAVPTSW